jgi:protein SCO1/2
MTSSSSTPSRLYRILRLGFPVIGALLIVTFFFPGQRRHPVLPKYGPVPPFSLTESSGRTVTNDDLHGKVWVADFIYTTCPGPCPIISASMARLQQKLAGDNRVQFVSFSVDPQDDTPAVLAAYANRFEADRQKWWFLTGPKQQMFDLIQKGFLQTLQDNHGRHLEPGQFLVLHSTYMVLVDQRGAMRGFYSGLAPDSRASLLDGIHQLENE